MLLGKTIEGVWHSAVVYDGSAEIFFGAGIAKARPGSTPFGTPRRVIDLGCVCVCVCVEGGERRERL